MTGVVAKSASDKNPNDHVWMVWNGSLNVTHEAARAAGFDVIPGGVFCSRGVAEQIVETLGGILDLDKRSSSPAVTVDIEPLRARQNRARIERYWADCGSATAARFWDDWYEEKGLGRPYERVREDMLSEQELDGAI